MERPGLDIFSWMNLVVDSNINGAFQAVLCGIRDSFDFEGTGTLLKFNSSKWLLTASHVVDAIRKNDNKIGLSTGETERYNPLIFFDLPDEVIEDRENDIAVVSLDHVPVARLANCKFMQLHNLGPFFFEKDDRNLLLVTGYPQDRARRVDPRRFFFKGVYYQTTENSGVNPYKSKEFPYHERLLLNYSPELIETIGDAEPGLENVRGLSGCPIWAISPGLGLWSFEKNVRLVGVATEQYPDSNVFAAARVSCVLRKMVEFRPDLEQLFDSTWEIWRVEH